jgi:hypothetical protein
MNDILGQLARTNLLPDDLAEAILAGNAPPLQEIVLALVVMNMDAEALICGDDRSSLTERRLAKMVLAIAFLSAMAAAGESKESV